MLTRRQIKAYLSQQSERKRKDKDEWTARERLTVALSLFGFLFSIFGVLFGATTWYYSLVRQLEEVSVVRESMPEIRLLRGSEQSQVSGELALVFINSGNRPVVLLQIGYRLLERQTATSRLPVDNSCYPEYERIKFTRLLPVNFEPFVIKEKEIVRRVLTLSPELDSPDGIKHENGTITLPFPAWVKDTGEYWLDSCLRFRLATPSNGYAFGGIVESGGLGFTKDVSYYGNSFEAYAPYVIWRHRSTIFDENINVTGR